MKGIELFQKWFTSSNVVLKFLMQTEVKDK